MVKICHLLPPQFHVPFVSLSAFIVDGGLLPGCTFWSSLFLVFPFFFPFPLWLLSLTLLLLLLLLLSFLECVARLGDDAVLTEMENVSLVDILLACLLAFV